MSRLNPTILLLLAVVVFADGQDPVIRTDVNVVQVDAVVTDSAGKHVGTLKAGDFVILQDGKAQTISNFSYVAPSVPAATPRGLAIAHAASPPVGRAALETKDVRRMIALVVDDLALSSDYVPQVRDALRKYASRELQPGDMVAVIRTSEGMGALQQFTTDRALLNKAIDQIKLTMGHVDIPPPIPGSPKEEEMAAREAMTDEFKRGNLVSGAAGTLRYVMECLRDMPCRKSVVLFCQNLPLSDVMVRDLSDAANRASVVINTIDPRGMATPLHLIGSQQGMLALADNTGGLFVKTNNLIDQALEDVIADSDGYYLIGYHPDAATFDSKTGAALYHKIQVRLKVGVLKVRSRDGFFGETDSARGAPAGGPAGLEHALTSPFASGAMRVQLTTLFNQTADRQSNLSGASH